MPAAAPSQTPPAQRRAALATLSAEAPVFAPAIAAEAPPQGAPAAVAQGASSDDPLVIERLSKGFDRGRLPVFAGINLRLRQGQRLAIIGANGSGKSTLLRCCLRLIEPDAGRIRLCGEDLLALRGRALRRARARVGFVFQRHQLVPQLSVLSNVLHGAQARRGGPRVWHHALASRHDRQEAMACLGKVGLADLAERRVATLSGGQSQRVAIARALMQRPRLILADEPVASLDPQAGEEVMELFVRLVAEAGLSLVFVSHHLEHALAYADRVVGLRQGSVAVDGSSRSYDLAQLRSFFGS